MNRAGRLKAEAIDRCQTFSHGPCGQEPDAVARQVGYDGASGENLFAGDTRFGSARVAVDRWLNSPGHRRNMFNPQWSEHGIALLGVATFDGRRDVAIWVSQFGRR